MSVRIQLDRPHAYFTNLDHISGRVVFSTLSDETISAIIVKLESESRTRLAAPTQQGRRDRVETELEVHKLLYKVIQVFPTLELQQQAPRNSAYTLPSGQHEYPFRFKIPFNNDCAASNSMFTNLNVTGRGMEMARNPNMHVKKALPPSLNGFPGEAEIQYYVKVTVQRPAFYKENFRARSDFKFLPIEPPREPPNRRESYARRSYQFSPHISIPEKSGLLRKPSAAGIDEAPDPPKIRVDGRLPDPAIVTCNEPLPLRVLVKRLNESRETIFLDSFQIELIGHTIIRAHELRRKESSSWIITSQSNMHVALGNSQVPADTDMEIDNQMWSRIPLPGTIPPSFETCNLSRTYEIEIRVGLACVQPLRMPVQVYSGVAPPPALLEAMAHGRQGIPSSTTKPPSNLQPQFLAAQQSPPAFSPSSPQPEQPFLSPHTPMTGILPSTGGLGEASASLGPGDDIPDEAPPSYEDAMADDLGPVDGPRREYNQSSVGTAQDMGNGKAGGEMGRNERLFP